ncbi:MAG: G5 domain-containing protein, partial [Tepidanaerobacteraceae bacterium]
PPITVKEDTNLPKGEIRIKQGSPGYVVKVWKTYISEEREEKVLVSTDTYNPTPTVLYSGVKAVENHESQVTQNGV